MKHENGCVRGEVNRACHQPEMNRVVRLNLRLYKSLCAVLIILGVALLLKGLLDSNGPQSFRALSGVGMIAVGSYYFFWGKPAGSQSKKVDE